MHLRVISMSKKLENNRWEKYAQTFHVYFKVKKIVFKNQLNQFQTIQNSVKTMKKLVFSALAMVGVVFGTNAQVIDPVLRTESHTVTVTVPEVALLDLVDGTDVSNPGIPISLDAPTVAGNAIEASKDAASLIYLQYSSIVPGSETRNIDVSVAAVKGGLHLKAVSTISGATGNAGNPATVANIGTTPSSIITGITSCYTGSGGGSGSTIQYTAISDNATTSDYANLRAAAHAYTVTYTLTDI